MQSSVAFFALTTDHQCRGRFAWSGGERHARHRRTIVLFVDYVLGLSAARVNRVLRRVKFGGAFLTLGLDFGSDLIELFAFALVPFQLHFQIFTSRVVLRETSILGLATCCPCCVVWFSAEVICRSVISVLISLISSKAQMWTCNSVFLCPKIVCCFLFAHRRLHWSILPSSTSRRIGFIATSFILLLCWLTRRLLRVARCLVIRCLVSWWLLGLSLCGRHLISLEAASTSIAKLRRVVFSILLQIITRSFKALILLANGRVRTIMRLRRFISAEILAHSWCSSCWARRSLRQ